MWYDSLLEKNKVPDFLIRRNIRGILTQRLQDENKGNTEAQQAHFMHLVNELKNSPIAVNTKDLNEPHYEVPTDFYRYCLGKHLKYSSGFWKEGVTDIDTSELDMLKLTCKRAELKDAQQVLELGCGWGSLSLYMAVHYPKGEFTVITNSNAQKIYIDEQAQKRGIGNLTVMIADISEFKIDETFDRIISVEMFEHMCNYKMLLEKIAGFLKPSGKLFIHIFTHKEFAYKFEVIDETDWMSKYFFTGGIMPSNNLMLYFNDHLTIEKHWLLNGMHYSKTSEAWLRNMDKYKKEIMPLFEKTYGEDQAVKWWVYWRVFFMACAELWGFNNGNDWMVSHYLFNKK